MIRWQPGNGIGGNRFLRGQRSARFASSLNADGDRLNRTLLADANTFREISGVCCIQFLPDGFYPSATESARARRH